MNSATETARTFELRNATSSDLPAIETLLSKSDLPLDGIEKCLNSIVVATQHGKLLGVAAIEDCGDVGLLRSVAVDPAERGSGIGRAVVSRAIELARHDGYEALYLLTMTAEKYFPFFGFENADRDRAPDTIRNNAQFRDLCPSTATLMWMPLE